MHLESGQEARIVQIDFSAAFDRVNHLFILYRIYSVGIGGCQTDHSTLWWMVVGVNWLTLYQECRRAVFWPVIVPTIHLGALFHSGE